MHLERYRGIIPEWETFCDTVSRPEPSTIRVSTQRVEPIELADRLVRQGFRLEPLLGAGACFRVVARPRQVSDTVEHWQGLYYIQQASTLVAAPLLGSNGGERILDLCAAPGGKTTHLSDLMGGDGTVVACEVNENRIRALLGNIYRTGQSNIAVVAGDGRFLPTTSRFDRVLADVPCSAEGTLRKRGGKLPRRGVKFLKRLVRRQEKLLRRAIELTRPGGTVLYVTCTFGPEENEAVVSRVLEDAPVEVEPIRLEIPHSPGLTEFDGERYDARLEAACRIYPHHLDSGGLFLCRLRRLEGVNDADQEFEEGSGSDGWLSVPASFPGGDLSEPAAKARIEEALERTEMDFGVSESVLDSFRWMVRGESVWAHTCREWPMGAWKPGGHWRTVSVGFRGFSLDAERVLRPSNDLLRHLTADVTRSRHDSSAEDVLAMLRGEALAMEGVTDGHIALGMESELIGRGRVKGGLLRHQVAKARAASLRTILGRERSAPND